MKSGLSILLYLFISFGGIRAFLISSLHMEIIQISYWIPLQYINNQVHICIFDLGYAQIMHRLCTDYAQIQS